VVWRAGTFAKGVGQSFLSKPVKAATTAVVSTLPARMVPMPTTAPVLVFPEP
jgi:hypothetical protein